jgi:hypothetical protein
LGFCGLRSETKCLLVGRDGIADPVEALVGDTEIEIDSTVFWSKLRRLFEGTDRIGISCECVVGRAKIPKCFAVGSQVQPCGIFVLGKRYQRSLPLHQ